MTAAWSLLGSIVVILRAKALLTRLYKCIENKLLLSKSAVRDCFSHCELFKIV